MVESNARQALMLENGDALPNDTGMAVGTAVTQEGTHYIVLPGPPREMKPMFERYAKPWIEARMDGVLAAAFRYAEIRGNRGVAA
ncbi:hypothetical protein LJK88_22665 [Paenibacillus sp. P26]|nr:hypothetical protein LJK88_22665 [Paenibacillus sp. P26]